MRIRVPKPFPGRREGAARPTPRGAAARSPSPLAARAATTPAPARRRARGWSLALLLLAAPLPAAAQDAVVVAGFAEGGAIGRIGALEVPREGGHVDLIVGAFPAPGLDLRTRGARAFGPLGTLTLEGEAGARALPELRARAMLGARGSFGPVAGRLQARAWAAAPERFDPLADPGAARADAGASLLVAGEGRVDRTWLLGGALRGERGFGTGPGDGWLLDVGIEARARRLLAREVDLELRAGGRVAGAGDGRAHLGAGATYAPRRAPEIVALAFLDAAPGPGGVRLAPGLEAGGGLRLGGGRLDWTVRWRPLAPSRAPWWQALSYARPLEVGTLRVEGALAHGGAAGTVAALAVRYERPLAGP